MVIPVSFKYTMQKLLDANGKIIMIVPCNFVMFSILRLKGMCEGIFLKTENGMGQGNRLISKILYSKNEKFVGNNQNAFW